MHFVSWTSWALSRRHAREIFTIFSHKLCERAGDPVPSSSDSHASFFDLNLAQPCIFFRGRHGPRPDVMRERVSPFFPTIFFPQLFRAVQTPWAGFAPSPAGISRAPTLRLSVDSETGVGRNIRRATWSLLRINLFLALREKPLFTTDQRPSFTKIQPHNAIFSIRVAICWNHITMENHSVQLGLSRVIF